MYVQSQVSIVRTEGGSMTTPAPISVPAAALTCGITSSVCRAPVIQVSAFLWPLPQMHTWNGGIWACFCAAGCRCPDGRLLQDGGCVRVDECRCGVPVENGTLEIRPGENVTVSCNTWWEELIYLWIHFTLKDVPDGRFCQILLMSGEILSWRLKMR